MIVFINIVDGERDDYIKLRSVLTQVSKEYKFVVAPKQIHSLSLEDLKALIKEVENDTTKASGKAE